MNHVCRAFNEHTGVCPFPATGTSVRDIWRLCIIHVTIYLKVSQTPNIGIYAPLTGTVAGPFGEIELSKSNGIILVYAIFIWV